jgi:hypothetical protein
LENSNSKNLKNKNRIDGIPRMKFYREKRRKSLKIMYNI